MKYWRKVSYTKKNKCRHFHTINLTLKKVLATKITLMECMLQAVTRSTRSLRNWGYYFNSFLWLLSFCVKICSHAVIREPCHMVIEYIALITSWLKKFYILIVKLSSNLLYCGLNWNCGLMWNHFLRFLNVLKPLNFRFAFFCFIVFICSCF